ncbi:MAG: SpoIIE family protein phosphatase [Oscillospiraceae bacterium]|nr:SpoIIE family protein phosphatase [Oscillospiraceae bacterium]
MVITEHIQSAKQGFLRFLASPPGKLALEIGGWAGAGFFLSAASLGRTFQPIAMSFVCAGPPGWGVLAAALGAAVGYPLFWGSPGVLGSVWSLCALGVALGLGNRAIVLRQKALIPALGALIVSAAGLWFLLRFDGDASIGIHLLRIGVGSGCAALFCRHRQTREGWTGWTVNALGVLALAQVWPGRYLGLGFAAAGYLAGGSPFPGVILAGLALDLSQVTRVKMTAVLCAGYGLARIPRMGRLMPLFSAAMAYVPTALLSGVWDVRPLPGLILGGALAALAPGGERKEKSTGEVALAQVRLEQMAQALRRMAVSLASSAGPEPDAGAILDKCRAAACDTCPERRQCRGRSEVLEPGLLEQPGLGEQDLPDRCRKPHRFLGELRRGQEQLRRSRAELRRTGQSREAVREQYDFLALLLEGLSDDLAQRHDRPPARFTPEVGVAGRSLDKVNGDCCIRFAGPGNRYYVLLCDGMGTGEAAARESLTAAELLKTMLSAGLPPEYALRSLNSLSILRDLGGCVTVDLLELALDTGRGRLYKWGAAQSWLFQGTICKKIGTAGPPPGLSQSCRETVDRLSLGRGETLILVSDGVSEEWLVNSARTTPTLPPVELAAAILDREISGGDDATAVVVRLSPTPAS